MGAEGKLALGYCSRTLYVVEDSYTCGGIFSAAFSPSEEYALYDQIASMVRLRPGYRSAGFPNDPGLHSYLQEQSVEILKSSVKSSERLARIILRRIFDVLSASEASCYAL